MANPIERYRATQRRIRRILDIYTARLCPDCAEPCCRKPTKVREFDVLLANACGCSLPSANDSVSEMVNAGIEIITGERTSDGELVPCDYLGEKGCIFPDDLRPFECTRWMCSFLKREIRPGDMRELRDLLHKLGVLHRTIIDMIDPRRGNG
jgi:hypothetical protein